MKKSTPAANPDAYVAALEGWQRPCVEGLRAAVRSSAKLDEVIKWGHLVYLSNGPVLLIRAEPSRVLFGFWRGKRLTGIEERLKPSRQVRNGDAGAARGDVDQRSEGSPPDEGGGIDQRNRRRPDQGRQMTDACTASGRDPLTSAGTRVAACRR